MHCKLKDRITTDNRHLIAGFKSCIKGVCRIVCKRKSITPFLRYDRLYLPV